MEKRKHAKNMRSVQKKDSFTIMAKELADVVENIEKQNFSLQKPSNFSVQTDFSYIIKKDDKEIRLDEKEIRSIVALYRMMREKARR